MNVALLFITAIAVLIAAFASWTAWRLVRENRRRAEARIGRLAAEIGTVPVELLYQEGDDTPRSGRVVELFSQNQAEEERAPSRSLTIVGSGLAISAVALTFIFLASRSGVSKDLNQNQDVSQQQDTVENTAIELVALTSERNAGGILVNGMVRSPEAAMDIRDLNAVVSLIDSSGEVVGSERALISNSGELAPGHEVPFTVRLGDVSKAARYKVSFQSGHHVIPHVDKRHGS